MNRVNLRFKSNRSPQAPEKLQCRSTWDTDAIKSPRKWGVIIKSGTEQSLLKLGFYFGSTDSLWEKKINCGYFSNQFIFLNSRSYSLPGCTIMPFSRSQKPATLMSQSKFSIYTFSTKASKIKQKLTLPGIKPLAYTGRCFFKYSFTKNHQKTQQYTGQIEQAAVANLN